MADSAHATERAWEDFPHAIGDAANALDRERGQLLCDELVDRFEGADLAERASDVRRVLLHLRRRRWFPLLRKVSGAFLDGLGDAPEPPEVRLQLIQALIEQGQLEVALDEAQDLRDQNALGTRAGDESRGLIGRIHKQAYVDGRRRTSPSRVGRLQRAVRAYWEPYRNDPAANWWHGINVVACLARGERDGIPVDQVAEGIEQLDWRALAEDVLERVAAYDQREGDYTWATATALEACIALGRGGDAVEWAERYISAPYADVFELASSERQLREVWGLDDPARDGFEALTIVQGQLGRIGGTLTLSPEVATPADAGIALQAQLGDESSRAVRWIQRLLDRASSVAKVMKDTDDESSGTGFFMATSELGGAWEAELVLVTNHHVVNREGAGIGMRPEQAVVKLTRVEGQPELRITRVLWESEELDACICQVDLEANHVSPLPPATTRDLGFDLEGDEPRLYVVGHPGGSDLRISLYDNQLIEVDEQAGRLRYRSPTEKGSSGSPVLTTDLEVVAVHHATVTDAVANQGILLDAVRQSLS